MSHIGLIASDEQVHAHSGAAASREMWQSVLHRAFLDATYDGDARADRMEQITADRWIRQCGKDFRTVCEMAGMDADFLSEAYRAGKVDRHLLKGSEECRTRAKLPRGAITQAVVDAIKGEMTKREIIDAVVGRYPELAATRVGDILTHSAFRTGKVERRKEGKTWLWSISETATQGAVQ
ncbi:hypothetical protein ACGYLO_16530 [Sulfitobacter sp. 1A13353]|uniref:hypothetical protein n=1 Tax=Sulfitobacter sp. 1A13353 TaxID=3368568 RepID=UPI0037464A01